MFMQCYTCATLWSENRKTLQQTQRAWARTVWSSFMCTACFELDTHSLRLCSALQIKDCKVMHLVAGGDVLASGWKHESILRYPTRSVSYFRPLYLASVAFQNPIVLIVQYFEVWYIFLLTCIFVFSPFALLKASFFSVYFKAIVWLNRATSGIILVFSSMITDAYLSLIHY